MADKKDDKKPKLKLVSNNKSKAQIPRVKDQAITFKQSEFARYITEGQTSSQAYTLAYEPSETATVKSIHEMACRVLANVKVKAKIKALQYVLAEENRTRTLRREEYVLKKLTEEVEQGDQASNRLKALHLLGQTVQMFGTKIEVDNKQADRTSDEVAEDLKVKLEKLLSS